MPFRPHQSFFLLAVFASLRLCVGYLVSKGRGEPELSERSPLSSSLGQTLELRLRLQSLNRRRDLAHQLLSP